MRIGRLVFSVVVTFSLTAAALTYVPGYVGQQRIYIHGHWDSSPAPKAYHSYGHSGNTGPDTARTATGDPDPYHQRYYSQSEGWTYYTLPSYSSLRSKK